MDNNLHKSGRNHQRLSFAVDLNNTAMFDIRFCHSFIEDGGYCIEKVANFNKSWPLKLIFWSVFSLFHSAERNAEVPPSSSVFYSERRNLYWGGSKVSNKSTFIHLPLLFCTVLMVNKSLLMFFHLRLKDGSAPWKPKQHVTVLPQLKGDWITYCLLSFNSAWT